MFGDQEALEALFQLCLGWLCYLSVYNWYMPQVSHLEDGTHNPSITGSRWDLMEMPGLSDWCRAPLPDICGHQAWATLWKGLVCGGREKMFAELKHEQSGSFQDPIPHVNEFLLKKPHASTFPAHFARFDSR